MKKEKNISAMERALSEKGELPLFSPYRGGDVGKRIVKILMEEVDISN